MVTWNSASGGFAYIWQSKWVGIIAVKTKRTQIHFLSDVLVAVASLDLRDPNDNDDDDDDNNDDDQDEDDRKACHNMPRDY